MTLNYDHTCFADITSVELNEVNGGNVFDTIGQALQVVGGAILVCVGVVMTVSTKGLAAPVAAKKVKTGATLITGGITTIAGA